MYFSEKGSVGCTRLSKIFMARNELRTSAVDRIDKLAFVMTFRWAVRFQELVLNFPTVLMACCLDMRTVVTTGMRLTAEAWFQLRGSLCGMYFGQSLKGKGLSPSNTVFTISSVFATILIHSLTTWRTVDGPVMRHSSTHTHTHIHGLMSSW
jgi:hypothetical protein